MSGLIKLTTNHAMTVLFTRFGSEVAQSYSPFDMTNGIVWNLIAMTIQGVVFFIITLLTELKTNGCERLVYEGMSVGHCHVSRIWNGKS